MKDLYVVGPTKVTGVSDTVSRRKIFTCRPTTPAEETSCARDIVRRLASQAFRGPVSGDDLTALLSSTRRAAPNRDFESGIASALERFSRARISCSGSSRPRRLRAGQRLSNRRARARVRACRFFLWGTGARRGADEGGLVRGAQPAGGVEKQLRRMLTDRRSEAISTRFATQGCG